MGVSIRLTGRGSVVEIGSEEQFPLASVYKVPLMATLYHKAQKRELSLEKRLVLKEIDKSLGSGDLQYFRPGATLAVHDICHLMIVHSDNTATDMIHYLVGFDAPNAYMRELGLNSFDIYCPGREYFLIFLGWATRFKGKSLGEIAKIWKSLDRDARVAIYKEVRKETLSRSVKEAQKLSIELWGVDDEIETKEVRDASGIMDNIGSPADVSKLLELIITNKIASPRLSEDMVEFMLLCDYREMIPAKIPPSIRVGNKTGGVPGTVNDCGIIFASKKNTVLCACFNRDVKYAQRREAREAIAEIGLLAYKAFRD